MDVLSKVNVPSVRLCLVFFLVSSLVAFPLVGCGGQEEDGVLAASGFIEGDEVIVAAESGGRVAETFVAEGDDVGVGELLLLIDDALLQTQRAEAVAAVTMAQANLAQVEAGPRPAEIVAAQAALAQAEAERYGAEQALENVRQSIDNPQELNAEIVAAETQVDLADVERTPSPGARRGPSASNGRCPSPMGCPCSWASGAAGWSCWSRAIRSGSARAA